MQRLAGFSLIELMLTLGIVVVVAGLAGPSFSTLVNQHRATAALNAMLGAVHLARGSAITRGAIVTLCPSRDGEDCAARNLWHEGAIVFTDLNANGRVDTGDVVLRGFSGFEDGARIYWRSFRNKSFLQLTATGLTNWQNGHFLYCPADRDPRLARQVILNAQARTRTARDVDGDGIAEDARGRPLTCP